MKELSDIHPYYAVKSNPDPVLLSRLAKNGISFDCASGREMEEVVRLGISTENILFANPHKISRDITLSKEYNIKETVVDSVEEVQKIADAKWKPNILIRLAVEDINSRSPFSIKFGAEKDTWENILTEIEKYHLPFSGVSFHIGSASSDVSQYERAINMCRDFMKETKRYIHTVDIGGGFIPETFSEASSAIQDARKQWMISKDDYPKRWIAEPGRFFSSKSHTLFTPIVAKKRGPGGKGWRYIIDESLYGQFSCIPFDHATPHWIHIPKDTINGNFKSISNTSISSSSNKARAFIFGRTCDSIDLIAYSETMKEMYEGDWLCFPSMGAYTMSSSSEFNGFPKPHTYYQDEGWLYTCIVNNSVQFPIQTTSSVCLSIQHTT